MDSFSPNVGLRKCGSSARRVDTKLKSSVLYKIRPCVITKQNTEIHI